MRATLMALLISAAMPPLAAADCIRGTYAGSAGDVGQEPFPILVTIDCEDQRVSGLLESPFGPIPITGGETTPGAWRLDATFDGQPLELQATRSGETWTGAYVLGSTRGVLTLRQDESATFARLSGGSPERLQLSDAEWREDLAFLVREIPGRHANAFHTMDRETWEREAANLGARVPALADELMPVALAELVARVGDGHTAIRLPQTGRLPIGMFWFGAHLRIVSAPVDRPELLGARVMRIGPRPASDAAELVAGVLAKENAWGALGATPYLLSREDVLVYYGLAEAQHPLPLRLRLTNGRTTEVQLAFSDAAVTRSYVAGAPPIWRRRRDDALWWEELPDGVFYINFRSYDQLRTRSAELVAVLDRLQPTKVVLDMRDNSGGDFTVFRETLLEAIRARPWLNARDRLFVLIGREMFSAAMTNAADLRLHTNATLVGEPIGERPNSYQEVRSFTLPNSGLRVGVSTQYYEALPGAGNPDAVLPHVRRPPTWRAFRQGRDDAIEWIIRS